jgi:hypothetical protein
VPDIRLSAAILLLASYHDHDSSLGSGVKSDESLVSSFGFLVSTNPNYSRAIQITLVYVCLRFFFFNFY